MPMAVLIRNKLKYALTYQEVKMVVMQKLVKVDKKVRTDIKFPCGFMDVVSIDKTNENFRMMLTAKGRFVPHKIKAEEAAFKLCKVKKIMTGNGNIPFAALHDGRTVRFVHPDVKADDTVKFDFATNSITSLIKFKVGNVAMATAGNSAGRVGVIESVEPHPGSFTTVQLKDSRGEIFATRKENVFVLGEGSKCAVSLPKGKGVKYTILETQQARLKGQ